VPRMMSAVPREADNPGEGSRPEGHNLAEAQARAEADSRLAEAENPHAAVAGCSADLDPSRFPLFPALLEPAMCGHCLRLASNGHIKAALAPKNQVMAR
jgi:hypothetical protein